MSKKIVVDNEHYPDPHHDMYSRTIFGFWLFILTDFILFGVLFATFAVLRKNTFGGPGALQLLNLDVAFTETILLLAASFTAGIGGAFAHRKNKKMTVLFFILTFVFGLAFFLLEMDDFSRLISSGNSWSKSAFLSAFFTVAGTHTMHVIFALIWVPVVLIPLIKNDIGHDEVRRLSCLRMLWQFLNIVWVFIFTFVYFAERG